MTDTVGELFTNAARRFGGRECWKTAVGSRSFQEVGSVGQQLANALLGAGLRPGDRVAMMLDDVVEALEIFAGIALAGMVVVPVNRDFKRGELDHILGDGECRALIYTESAREAVAESDVVPTFALALYLGPGSSECAVATEYALFLSAAKAVPPGVARRADDPAMIAYTSGTTGFPKGAVISNRSILLCARTSHGVFQMGNYARMVHPGSLQFSAPWWAVLLPHIYVGGSVRLLGRFTVESWFDALEEERATYTYVPSPLIRDFVEQLRSRPTALESLQSVLHGSSVAPREHIAELIDAVGSRFVEGYGSTETVGPVIATTRDDFRSYCEADDIYSSVGRPVPTSQALVVDEEGGEVPPGEGTVGELAIEADTLFDGYWNRPEQTAEVFDGRRLLTGDLARVDAAGYVYIVGRKAELIISGGANVYPAEVERTLSQMDAVDQCAVVGVPHERWGETVAAALVPAAGSRLTESDVQAFARERLAGYKKPTIVAIVDELPRNASAKVDKTRLRDVVQQMRANPQVGGSSQERRRVR